MGLTLPATDEADMARVQSAPAVFVSAIGRMLPEPTLLSARNSSIRCRPCNSRSGSHAIPVCPEERARFASDC